MEGAEHDPDYSIAEEAFQGVNLLSSSDDDLRRYLAAMCRFQTGDDAIYARNLMRVSTLNQMLLTRHITKLDQQSVKIQKWFIALAVASLIASFAQIAFAI